MKKILSILLTVAMLLTMIPVFTVSAAEATTPEVSTAKMDSTVMTNIASKVGQTWNSTSDSLTNPAVPVAKMDGIAMTGASAYEDKPWNNTADGLTNLIEKSIFVFDQEFKEGTIEFTMTTGGGDNGVIFGLDGDSMNFWEEGPQYYFVFVNNNSGELILAKTGEGLGWCWMKSMPAAGFVAGAPISVKVEYDGDGHIRMYTNDTLVYDYCDAHPLTGTRVGVRAGGANITYTDISITTTNDGPDSGIAGGQGLPFTWDGDNYLSGYVSGGPWCNDGSAVTIYENKLVTQTWATTFVIDNDHLPLKDGSLTATVRASSSVAQSDNWLTGIVFGIEAQKNVTIWKNSAYTPRYYVLFVDQNKKLILSKGGVYNEDDTLQDLAMTDANAIADYEIGSSYVEIKAEFVTNDDGSVTIKGYANGVQLLEYTDTDPCTGFRYGFAARCAGSELTSLVPIYNTDNQAYSKGLEYEYNGNGTCIVTGIGICADTNIIIPTINPEGYMVTSIGEDAFYGCSNLTSVVIPNSVTSIGSSAFWGCSSLMSIEIPDSVTTLDSHIFTNCKNLTSVTISKCVTSIDDYTFYGCSSLTSIEIPDSVTSIGDKAFWSCYSLTSIVIGDGVTSIGDDAFWNCSYSLKSLVIGDGITSLNDVDDLLDAYDTLESIVIGDGVTSIGEDTFEDYSCLTNVIIGNGVTSIGSSAFNGCIGLTSIVIPDSVTYIGWMAFNGCSSLTSIEIPDSVTSIGDKAFRSCYSLTSIVIGDGVTSIGWMAFDGCISLTSINIPNGVTEIGESAFYGCSSLTSINIPDGVTEIGSHTFNGCSSLTSINIPNGVTEIGEGAFKGCSSLTSIAIPDSVTYIGWMAFSDCSGLTSITVSEGNTVYHSAENCLIETESKTLISGCKNSVIPNDGSVTNIYARAFYGCSSLTSIEIPDSVTEIGYEAFAYCISLTSIEIPDSVTIIYLGTFCGCSSLTSIEIPDSVTGIAERAFDGCSSLTSIVIPDSVTYIGYDAFAFCTSLTSIVIPKSVTELGAYGCSPFWGCSSLTSITVSEGNTVYHSAGNCLIETESKTLIRGCKNSIIPNDGSVTTISFEAFAACSSLTSINIPDSVTSIGDYAFYGCTSLTSITIYNPECVISDLGKSSATTIYGYAGSTAQTYAEEHGNPFVALPSVNEEKLTVEEDKVTIDSSNTNENIMIPSDISTRLADKETTIITSAGTITFDTTASNKIAASGNISLNIFNVTTEDDLANNIFSFSITLRAGGYPLFPFDEADTNGNITVSVPYLPGLKLQAITVTYIGEDGTTEDIPVVAYDPETGIVTFTTTHLSRYEISSKAGIPGDTDGSGKVNMRDIALIQQYLNGKDVAIDLSVADVDGSGKINMRDAALIQQYLNGKDVELK